MNLVIESALAHAQSLYPVRICCYLVEGTHIHLILIVDNPIDVVRFMERFKTESAHRINRLLGRKKRTVWCEGYDSPPLLTHTTVIDKIVYIYSNPSKDNLEESIEKYPGLSSWEAFRSGVKEKKVPFIRRPFVRQLNSRRCTAGAYDSAAERLIKESKGTLNLKLDPDAWMDCFGITDPQERADINAKIITSLRERESEYCQKRKAERRSVMGRDRLAVGSIDPSYIPERFGRRMWCHSDDPVVRKTFIAWLKGQIQIAKETYQAWKQGDYRLSFPIGFFPPCCPRTANLHARAVYC